MGQAINITVAVPLETFREAYGSIPKEDRRALGSDGFDRNQSNREAEYLLRCALTQLARDAGHSVPSGHDVVPQPDGSVEVVDPEESGDGDRFDFL